MSARDELDRWQAEAQTNAVLGRTATQENARQMLAAVKALRDVLDELDEWERAGHLSIEMVHIRRAIEAAIGGEGR